MARKRRPRRSRPSQSADGDGQQPQQTQEAQQAKSSIARLSYPDQDTLQLRTFWSPLPNWAYGAIPAVICAVLAIVLFGGDDVVGVAMLGAAAGFFGGGILWAVLGVIGGDVLIVDFDLNADVARVKQSALWMVNREFSFDLYDIESLETTRRRSRPLFLQFAGSYSNWLMLEEGERMRIGVFPTEGEADAVAVQISDFLGVDLQRAD